MIPEKENQQERCLHPSPGLQQPLAPGPPGRMIPWLRRMLGRGARAGGRERHHEVSSGVLEAQYSSVRNALGPVWLRGPEAMAKVQGCKVRRRTRRWHVPLLPSSPLPFLPFFEVPFLTGHFCIQAWSLLSRTGSICPLPTPQGETRPQDSGWGQSLEPGREPLTEGRSSPLRPEASIQSLLQQRKLLNRA